MTPNRSAPLPAGPHARLPPPAAREQPHGLPVGALPSGVELQLAPGEREGALQIACALVGLDKAGQCLHGQPVQVLLLEKQPLLEFGAPRKRKTFQEAPTIQGGRLLKT